MGRTVTGVIAIGVWLYVICHYPSIRLLTLLVPPIAAIQLARNPRWRNIFITVFVILWLAIFHYESIRYFYLNPLAQRDLPKFKFLFPPAGWIMFYNVDETYSYVDVYGKRGEHIHPIDPHDIFRTRTIGFDNIHRNVVSVVSGEEAVRPFCQYLKWRFPDYDDFVVVAVYYPSLIQEPHTRWQRALYRCGP